MLAAIWCAAGGEKCFMWFLGFIFYLTETLAQALISIFC